MKEYHVLKIYSEELQKEKRIFIFLPKSYYISDNFYPVLYMHDGHNLFDDKQATYGKSWGILEAFEKDPTIPEVIIVGIETEGDSRSDELVPYVYEFEGNSYGGKADLYLKFITTKLKPYIDRRFRTFKSSKNTGIMGSSYGGLNALYAALVYGSYFTRFGCVSSAYFYGGYFNKLKALVDSTNLKSVKKFYMDVGTKETDDLKQNNSYIKSNKEMYELLRNKIEEGNIRFDIIEDGVHNEKDWEKRFPEIIKFMFND